MKSEFYEELTTMAGYIKEHSIAVSCDPLFIGEPLFKYFEQYRGKSNRAACISLLRPRYLILEDYTPYKHYELRYKQKRQLMRWLTSPCTFNCTPEITNWQNLIVTFNYENIYHRKYNHKHDWYKFTKSYIKKHARTILNSSLKFAIPFDYPMPNYLNLN